MLALHPNVVDSGLFEGYCRVVEDGEPLELLDWGYAQDLLDGEWRYYDVRAVRHEGFISQIWVDVTDRHLALERLAESEERYRLLAENASDVVYRASVDGVVEWISPQSKDLVGWAPEEMVGRPVRDFVHLDDLPIMMAGHARVTRGLPAGGQVRIRTSSGPYRWVSVTAKPVFDPDGSVIGRVGSWTDVEDIVGARDEAQYQRVQTQAILDTQLDPFIRFTTVRDAQGRAVDLRFDEANPAAFAYNNSTPEDMLGRTFLEFFPGLHGERADGVVPRVRRERHAGDLRRLHVPERDPRPGAPL